MMAPPSQPETCHTATCRVHCWHCWPPPGPRRGPASSSSAPRSSPVVVAGFCAVDDFVTALGVHIVGWSAARRGICAPASELLVAELERLTTAARGAAAALGVPQTAAMGASVALTGALTTCTEVRLDGAGPCAFPEIRAEFSAYWTHILGLARVSGIDTDAASHAVLAVRRAANADGRHLVDNARHLVMPLLAFYKSHSRQ